MSKQLENYSDIFNQRSVSIYGSKSKGFANQNAELLFAKDYNKFLYSDKSAQSPQRNFSKTQSSFKDTQHIEVLKQNISSIQQLRANSPNYRRENPITHEGKSQSKERSHLKSTPLSNIDNINLQTPDRDFKWKPCVRKINLKESETDANQKRQLKSGQFKILDQDRNPLMGGSVEPTRKSKNTTGNGDQVISEQQKNIANTRSLLPSQRRSTGNIDNFFFATRISTQENEKPALSKRAKQSGQDARGLLNYEFAPEFRDQRVTQKCTSYQPETRQYSYQDVNTTDHRKKKTAFQPFLKR